MQYPTVASLKYLFNSAGTVQEVFRICSDSEKARAWLIEQEIATEQEYPPLPTRMIKG